MDNTLKLGMIFDGLAEEISISNTDYDRAVTSYTALGKYLREHNEDWDVNIYPQGSFELGTVVKPITDEDQYDVDLVVQINKPNFDEEEIRKNVIHLLEEYGHYKDKVEEKKPCLRIAYAASSQFHMDITCAKPKKKNNIEIIEASRKAEDGTYYYAESDPVGYIGWFKTAMQFERLQQEKRSLNEGKTEVQELTLPTAKSPLQKAIQILKRHRDIYFKDNLEKRPSSIILTTICAMSYNAYGTYKSLFESLQGSDRGNVYLILKELLGRFPHFISTNSEWVFYLKNPTLSSENFLNKWNEKPELKEAFDEWYRQAQLDIVNNPSKFINEDAKKLSENLRSSFGVRTTDNALKKYGEKFGRLNESGNLNIDKKTMSTVLSSTSLDIVKSKPNTYFGD